MLHLRAIYGSRLGWALLYLWVGLGLSCPVLHAQQPGKPKVQLVEQRSNTFQFTENKGQWEGAFSFTGRIPSGQLWAEDNGLRMLLVKPEDVEEVHHHRYENHIFPVHVLKLEFVGALHNPVIQGLEDAGFPSNFYLGNDSRRWKTDVRTYRQLEYQQVYPGVHFRLFAQAERLKYEFYVEPGSPPDMIGLRYAGAAHTEILPDGKLQLRTSLFDVLEDAPVAYHRVNGVEIPVACRFRLDEEGVIRFSFPQGYDPDLPLTIDPTLIFCTHSGSLADNWGFTATYDSLANFYAGGIVQGFGFTTTTGAAQAGYNGGVDSLGFSTVAINYGCDLAIQKFDPTGAQLLFATYLGGTNNEQPHSMVADQNSNLYILGTTKSFNFPTTPSAYDPTFNGKIDIVLSRLSANGALLNSTFIGGAGDDGINTPGNILNWHYADDARGEIILDAQNNVYVASCTRSANFPMTPGAYQASLAGSLEGIVFSMTPALTALRWSTFLGGSDVDALYGLALAKNGTVYVAGATASSNFPVAGVPLNPSFIGGVSDGVLLRLNNNGTALLASTFIGTLDRDQIYFVQLDEAQDVYITGLTNGFMSVVNAGFSNPNSGQFISKLSPNLSSLLYNTTFGRGDGDPDITPTAFLVDDCNYVYVSGWGGLNEPNGSSFLTLNMPTTPGAIQTTTDGRDFYFIVLTQNSFSLHYGTYYGLISTSPFGGEHVDGGTSRFDRRGVIYQCICAGCGGETIPTTAGVWSPINRSSNCNMASLKIDFEARVRAEYTVTPDSACQFQPIAFDARTNLQGTQFEWTFGDGTSSNLQSPSKIYSNPGTYNTRLITINPASCNQRDTFFVQVRVLPLPQISISAPVDTCALTVPFRVNTNVGLNGFFWRFGDGNTSTQANPTHTYTSDGTYDIDLIAQTQAGCADTASFRVTVFSGTTPSFNVQQPPCALNAGFTNTTNPPRSVLWDFGDGTTSIAQNPAHVYAQPGSYVVQLITLPGTVCADTSERVIQVPLLPDADFTYTYLDPCSLTVELTSRSQQASSYLWEDGIGNRIPSLLPVQTFTFPNSGTYPVKLVVNPDSLCRDSITYSIPAGLNTQAAILVRTPTCDTIVTLGNGSTNAREYQWEVLGQTFTEAKPTVVFPGVGNYPIRLIANPNTPCADTAETLLRLGIPPNASFEVAIVPCLPILDFRNTSDTAFRYEWDLGDGRVINGYLPGEVTYPRAGRKSITLRAFDTGLDCYTEATREIEYDPDGSEFLFIPNAFTPNGDGLNERFELKGPTSACIRQLLVFDRWGVLIHEYRGGGQWWDGTYRGKPCTEGGYVYRLELNNRFEKAGVVTLLR